ncbi:MAG: hypothetical protein BWX64_02271 [Acidobacteria bacterium ADurb.Bin051]|nr:MAG: hypothetical protein BWX64_02271 [Acidobacteria bacterium ADurb.Bin051]
MGHRLRRRHDRARRRPHARRHRVHHRARDGQADRHHHEIRPVARARIGVVARDAEVGAVGARCEAGRVERHRHRRARARCGRPARRAHRQPRHVRRVAADRGSSRASEVVHTVHTGIAGDPDPRPLPRRCPGADVGLRRLGAAVDVGERDRHVVTDPAYRHVRGGEGGGQGEEARAEARTVVAGVAGGILELHVAILVLHLDEEVVGAGAIVQQQRLEVEVGADHLHVHLRLIAGARGAVEGGAARVGAGGGVAHHVAGAVVNRPVGADRSVGTVEIVEHGPDALARAHHGGARRGERDRGARRRREAVTRRQGPVQRPAQRLNRNRRRLLGDAPDQVGGAGVAHGQRLAGRRARRLRAAQVERRDGDVRQLGAATDAAQTEDQIGVGARATAHPVAPVGAAGAEAVTRVAPGRSAVRLHRPLRPAPLPVAAFVVHPRLHGDPVGPGRQHRGGAQGDGEMTAGLARRHAQRAVDLRPRQPAGVFVEVDVRLERRATRSAVPVGTGDVDLVDRPRAVGRRDHEIVGRLGVICVEGRLEVLRGDRVGAGVVGLVVEHLVGALVRRHRAVRRAGQGGGVGEAAARGEHEQRESADHEGGGRSSHRESLLLERDWGQSKIGGMRG